MNRQVFSRYLDQIEKITLHFVRHMHQQLAGTLEEGITGQQFAVMKIIHDRGRATVTEVAEDLYVSLSAVTALVDRLCRSDMVVRKRTEQDRRVVWLELTPRGKTTVDICLEGRQQVVERFLGGLTEQELLQLITIYEKILSSICQDEQDNLKDTGKTACSQISKTN